MCWAYTLYFYWMKQYKCIFWSLGVPHSSVDKESACNTGDPSLIPETGRSTGEGIGCPLQYSWASLVAQLVKNPPAMQETWVRSLGWEDPLEKGKATYSSILVWRIPWTCPWGHKESDRTEQLSLYLLSKLSKIKTYHFKLRLYCNRFNLYKSSNQSNSSILDNVINITYINFLTLNQSFLSRSTCCGFNN